MVLPCYTWGCINALYHKSNGITRMGLYCLHMGFWTTHPKCDTHPYFMFYDGLWFTCHSGDNNVMSAALLHACLFRTILGKLSNSLTWIKAIKGDYSHKKKAWFPVRENSKVVTIYPDHPRPVYQSCSTGAPTLRASHLVFLWDEANRASPAPRRRLVRRVRRVRRPPWSPTGNDVKQGGKRYWLRMVQCRQEWFMMINDD